MQKEVTGGEEMRNEKSWTESRVMDGGPVPFSAGRNFSEDLGDFTLCLGCNLLQKPFVSSRYQGTWVEHLQKQSMCFKVIKEVSTNSKGLMSYSLCFSTKIQ